MRFLELNEELSDEKMSREDGRWSQLPHDRRVANLAAHEHHRTRLLRDFVPVSRHRVGDHELQPWILDARPPHGDFQLFRPRR